MRTSPLRLALILAALMALCSATPAVANIEILSFGGSATGPDGAPLTQAGAHPDVKTSIRFATELIGPRRRPVEQVRDLLIDLPPGLVGAPSAIARCSAAQMSGGFEGTAVCPIQAQVGTVTIRSAGYGAPPDGYLTPVPLYNTQPAAGAPATFAFNYAGTIIRIVPGLSAGEHYTISAASRNTSQGLSVIGVDVTLWGVPADPSHDALRLGNIDGFPTLGVPAGADRVPLMTNPTRCSGQALTTVLRADSWETPGVFDTASFSSDFDGNPLMVTGCDRLAFAPTGSVQPSSSRAGGPTDLNARITVPQNDSPDGLATAHLKKARVTLPEGMAINPSSADGLGACGPAQIGLGSNDPVGCPDSSKIGTAVIKTPLITDELSGEVYLASQDDNPFHSTFAVYLVAHGPGLLVKLPGRVDTDAATGRVTATFDDNPEVPFDSIDVRFNGGDRAPLMNAMSCGSSASDVQLTSWASTTPVNTGDVTRIDQDCDRGGRFEPSMVGGVTNPAAGSSTTSFTLRVSRPDGQRDVQKLDVVIPTGLLGKVGGVAQCAEPQAAAGGCPEASRVGHTVVSAGAGSTPVSIPQPGKPGTAVYLAGPYKGAPFSLSIVVPATAGPLNLGTVVVRAGLSIDPITAQVTVKSDPLPTILMGVPLHVRDIDVIIDRAGFMINPTSCQDKKITATATAVDGRGVGMESRFKVGGCTGLNLKPQLGLTLSGKGQTKDGGHPAVSAVLSQPAGGANLKKVRVTLPLSLALDPDNSDSDALCSFVEGSKPDPKCPTSSIVGRATAVSPVLHEPLSGPVYFVKNERKDPKSGRSIKTTPKLVIPLVGENGVKLTLTGASDVVDDQLVTTFDNIPDAPVSSFKMDITGGKKGILVVSAADICKATQIAAQEIDGQNNKTADASVSIQTPSCPLKVVSKKVGKTSVAVKVSGLGAGKVTVSGKGIKKTTKTITKSTVATITAKRTKGKPAKVTVSFDPTGPAKVRRITR
jgi:hypothetical protein